MPKKVYTNAEKLAYFKRRVEELEDICKTDPHGLQFQNWQSDTKIPRKDLGPDIAKLIEQTLRAALKTAK